MVSDAILECDAAFYDKCAVPNCCETSQDSIDRVQESDFSGMGTASNRQASDVIDDGAIEGLGRTIAHG